MKLTDAADPMENQLEAMGRSLRMIAADDARQLPPTLAEIIRLRGEVQSLVRWTRGIAIATAAAVILIGVFIVRQRGADPRFAPGMPPIADGTPAQPLSKPPAEGLEGISHAVVTAKDEHAKKTASQGDTASTENAFMRPSDVRDSKRIEEILGKE